MEEHEPLFEIRDSPIDGKGAFALKLIPKGTRLIEYTGERISAEEADARYDEDAMEKPYTVLFTVTKDIIIDAGVGGNEARFINHSCEPNCEAVIDDKRIFIEAIRDIPPGAELAYDYQLEYSGRYQSSWRERYACRCGAPTCRGTLLLPKKKRGQKG